MLTEIIIIFPFFVLKICIFCGKICQKELRTIDWLKIEINEKLYKRLLIIGIVLVIAYLMITFLSFAVPRIYHMAQNTVMDTEGTVKTGINHLYRGSFRLELSGWAYKPGEDIETFNSCYILKNRANQKMYQIRASKKMMPELQFVDGKQCLNAGIEAQSIILGLQIGMYDLYILYQNNQENLLVDTGIEVDL